MTSNELNLRILLRVLRRDPFTLPCSKSGERKGNGGRGEELAFRADSAEPSRSPICSSVIGLAKFVIADKCLDLATGFYRKRSRYFEFG